MQINLLCHHFYQSQLLLAISLSNMAQCKEKIEVKTKHNDYVLYGRPCELSAYSFIPPQRCDPKERTYFNVDKQHHYGESNYDRLFHQDYGYSTKLHRDDREHAKSRGLEVNAEEKSKKIPSLSSSVYGHLLDRQIDQPGREHVRIGIVQSEFYRRNGINAQSPEKNDS